MNLPVNVPNHPWIVRAVTIPLIAGLLCAGCVSNRFKQAPAGTAPPDELNLVLARTPFEAGLATLITYNGPGSWKRDAFWDEYAVSFRNPGSQPLTLASADLVDFVGTRRPPGSQPWALEKESKTLERQYRDLGLAFVRYTAPAVLIVGAGAGIIAGAGIYSATAATAAAATVVALPLYYLGVMTINSFNKAAMEKEFSRRRLTFPLTLAPGETRAGSLFFPMVPGPRSLNLHWTAGPAAGEAVLPLDFLRGLHLQAGSPPASPAHSRP